MYVHADLICQVPGLGAGDEADLAWPLSLDPVQIGELLDIPNIFGPAVPRGNQATVRVRQPLVLETVLRSRARRWPYFQEIANKLEKADPQKKAQWFLRLVELELQDPDEVDTQERVVPVLIDPEELLPAPTPLFTVQEIEEFLTEIASREEKPCRRR